MRKVYCNKCGQKIPNDSKYCYKCGSGISINSTPLNSGNEKVSNKKTWIITIVVLLFLPILSWTFFFNSLALTILIIAWRQGKMAFQYKNWVKLIAIIVIACISFALVAGIKGAMQTEKKNKLYKNAKHSLLISDNNNHNFSVFYFN